MRCRIPGFDNCYFVVELADDGTLDTVLEVTRHDFEDDSFETRTVRLSGEFAAEYRDDDGSFSPENFKELAEFAIDDWLTIED